MCIVVNSREEFNEKYKPFIFRQSLILREIMNSTENVRDPRSYTKEILSYRNDGPTENESSKNSDSQIQVSEKTPKNETNSEKGASRFRIALPQILASTAKNMILMDLGMTIAFPTIVIPALLESKSSEMAFSLSDASWFGSIAFICQPVGSILSGIVLEPLGRKYSLLIVNFPHILGWLLFYNATSTSTVFIANVIMGLGVGFMEAPIITYVGEICEPQLRGILISYSGLFFNIGVVVIYGLGNVTDWQTAALISTVIPIVTVLAITQVPETPYWLLSRGRIAEAEKSLCWLRGWVKPEFVQKELQEMVSYSDSTKFNRCVQKENTQPAAAYSNHVSLDDEKATSRQNNDAEKKNNADISDQSNKVNNDEFVTVELPQKIKDNDVNNLNNNQLKHEQSVSQHKMKFSEYCKDLIRPEVLKPLVLVLSFFFFLNFAGISAMRPYQVEIFKTLGFPINPYRATVVMSVTGFIATVLCMICVKFLGKRRLSLIALFCTALAIFSLSLYAKLNHSGEEGIQPKQSYLPFILFFVVQFFFSFGVAQVPWMLVSEVFPYRGRSQASGFAAACSYILSFAATKTFLGLQETLSLSGVLAFYGTCSIVGLITMYKFLPETEGRSLEEIEEYFRTLDYSRGKKQSDPK